jgi:hypothetical protein
VPGSGIHIIEIDAASASGNFKVDGEVVKGESTLLDGGNRVGYALRGMGVQLLINGLEAERFRLGVQTRRWVVARSEASAAQTPASEATIDLDVEDGAVYLDRLPIHGAFQVVLAAADWTWHA